MKSFRLSQRQWLKWAEVSCASAVEYCRDEASVGDEAGAMGRQCRWRSAHPAKLPAASLRSVGGASKRGRRRAAITASLGGGHLPPGRHDRHRAGKAHQSVRLPGEEPAGLPRLSRSASGPGFTAKPGMLRNTDWEQHHRASARRLRLSVSTQATFQSGS